ncbi:cytochrome P450 [Aspergillus tanneri]|uniref:Cytochrome P450 n=1 Tax=Aspergillus tanneri TaxID=1220188 RepID=A0A5M9N998_9EURO|nr:uncharacterized protein ATNIH1004_000055 [Aspergillus tanneri]KAA8651177.1 hypothetical protein ATNIH1004_000055 [Aspergillus tanneri]
MYAKVNLGPIVRITPHELHVKDPNFYDEIYAGATRPRNRYLPSIRMLGLPQSSAATVEHDLHRSRRRVLTSYFSKQSVMRLESLINKKIEKLLKRFEKFHEDGTVVRLDSAFSALAGDITSHYTYGYSYDYLDHEVFRNDVREAIINLLGIGHIAKFFPFIPFMLRNIPQRVVRWYHPGAAQVLEFRNTLRRQSIETLRNSGRGHREDQTIFDALNDPRLEKQERTISRLENEAFLILAAGTETTAQPLNVILFHLLDNKRLLSKLHYEMKQIMPELNSFVSWTSLEKIPYLRAVVYEGIRLANGPMSRLPRVAPNEALKYQGWVIPPGTPVKGAI